jgi:hypothetical protein
MLNDLSPFGFGENRSDVGHGTAHCRRSWGASVVCMALVEPCARESSSRALVMIAAREGLMLPIHPCLVAEWEWQTDRQAQSVSWPLIIARELHDPHCLFPILICAGMMSVARAQLPLPELRPRAPLIPERHTYGASTKISHRLPQRSRTVLPVKHTGETHWRSHLFRQHSRCHL